MTGHGRHRAIVLLSTPALCAVCQGRRVVQLVRPTEASALRRCPHCTAGPRPIPISIWPMRTDHPRGAA